MTLLPPHRIQRKRSRGWKMPANTIYVGRPTIWGNPFVHNNPQQAVIAFNDLLKNGTKSFSLGPGPDNLRIAKNAHEQTLHWAWCDWAKTNINRIKGKHLACWCPITKNKDYHPCHADVLLALANDIPIESIIHRNIEMAGD